MHTPLTPERLAELKRSMTGTRCGHEDATGELIVPCGQPANGHRWYQDVEHEDAIGPACDEHRNEGGRIIAGLLDGVDEVARLREALTMTIAGRCYPCGWPFAKDDCGCVPGNCSFRPGEQSPHHLLSRGTGVAVNAGQCG